MKNFILTSLLIFVPALFPSSLLADWINLSGAENSRNIAEIHVEKDHVKIKLEIFIQDALIFEELIPDRLLSASGVGRPGPEKRARQFSEHGLQVITETGLRTYLYIEPYEVRHEILVRVKDMMAWVEFDLRGDEHIEVDEFDPVREKVANFFMEREKVLIDGTQLKPILDKTAYVESSMLRSSLSSETGRFSQATYK